MQDNNRFFRLVWRINALAIACLVVLVGLLGLYQLTYFLKWQARDRQVTDLVAVAPQTVRQEESRLGQPNKIAGTQIVRMPLYLEQKTDDVYFSKGSSGNIVNELFVDSSTGKSNWLFKGTSRLVLNQNHILSQLKSEQPLVTSILYTLVEKDSNGDGTLSQKDQVTVGYSSLDGTVFTPLIDNVEKLYATEQVSDDRLLIIYSRNGETRAITYSVPSYTTVVDNALPKLDATP